MNLRDKIIAEMRRHKGQREDNWKRIMGSHPVTETVYPTWWFRHEIGEDTTIVRKELIAMERDGLVKKSPTSRRGQAEWVLL